MADRDHIWVREVLIPSQRYTHSPTKYLFNYKRRVIKGWEIKWRKKSWQNQHIVGHLVILGNARDYVQTYHENCIRISLAPSCVNSYKLMLFNSYNSQKWFITKKLFLHSTHSLQPISTNCTNDSSVSFGGNCWEMTLGEAHLYFKKHFLRKPAGSHLNIASNSLTIQNRNLSVLHQASTRIMPKIPSKFEKTAYLKIEDATNYGICEVSASD